MTSRVVDIDHAFPNLHVEVIDLQASDDLWYRYERTDGNAAALTATVDIGFGLSMQDQPFSLASLILDGTTNKLDVEAYAFAHIITNTAQAARKGRLHIYHRPRAIRLVYPVS